MQLEPLYRPDAVTAAYCLRYSWTAWLEELSHNDLWEESINGAAPLWEQDGMRLLEKSYSADKVQLAFSTTPTVSPMLLATRAKGRLQHALRIQDKSIAFRRKFSVRSIGNNSRSRVENYISNQARTAGFCDARFADALEKLKVVDPRVDLSRPTQSGRGYYWYNLHLVLEAVDGYSMGDLQMLAELCEAFGRIARAKGHGLAYLSPMPNHVHAALRGQSAQSPEEIALSYLNNLAYIFGQKPIWRSSFYAGSFSEYDMGAIRASKL